jgi:hypothetical protein
MARLRFIHMLSFPEHIWLDFFRHFFAQKVLVVDENLDPIPNNFLYEEGQTKANRKFDVLLEEDLEDNNPNILPALVIEDLGLADLGITIDKLRNWTVDPRTSKTRSDLLRTTYVFHCCARKRHESRLMASIVASSVVVFYNQLLQAGLHKIEPFSVGRTVPIKSDSDEAYLATPVQITFEYEQAWKTVEDGPTGVRSLDLAIRPDELLRYVRTIIDVVEPSAARFVAMSMNLQDPNAKIYVNTSMNLVDPLVEERYILTSMDTIAPSATTPFVRMSMRVA